jgi:hypothetical protein
MSVVRTPEQAPPAVFFEQVSTVVGASTGRKVNGYSTWALQVAGIGAVATAWDIRLEGSCNGGASYTQILAHTTATGHGVVVWSGSSRNTVDMVRVNVVSLTLGGASSMRISIEGAP